MAENRPMRIGRVGRVLVSNKRESDKTRAEIVRQMPKLSPFAVYPYKTEKSPS